jgi:hypothetical protein
MANRDSAGKRFHTFDDLESASDETLRQIAARVHIVDLAYAFGSGDMTLRERLLGSVRPGLRSQIESAIRTIEVEADRYPQDTQVRSARARVMQVVHDSPEFD